MKSGYAVAVRFRNRSLTLFQGIRSLDKAVETLERLRAERFHDRDDLFVIDTTTGEPVFGTPNEAALRPSLGLPSGSSDAEPLHDLGLQNLGAVARPCADGALVFPLPRPLPLDRPLVDDRPRLARERAAEARARAALAREAARRVFIL